MRSDRTKRIGHKKAKHTDAPVYRAKRRALAYGLGDRPGTRHNPEDPR